MTNQIKVEDVKNVIQSLKMNVTEEKINWVMENFDGWSIDDPTSNWSEIVESMLYSNQNNSN